MPKLIVVSSLMLFWAFYEMSGGADFEPKSQVAEIEVPKAEPAPALQIAPASIVEASFEVVETTPLPPAAPVPAPTPVFYAEPVIIPAPAAAVPEPVAVTEPAAPVDLRYVSGNRVNLRAGPGTQHAVLATLPRGTATAFIEANDDGWVKIRMQDSDQVGWMAARLLSER